MTYFDSPFINVVGNPMPNGNDYMLVTRRNAKNMVINKNDYEYKIMMPDAVACALIIKVKDKPARLFLQNEFRYPLGRFLLSPPAGLIDDDLKYMEELDMRCNAIIATAAKEIFEETGLDIKKSTQCTTRIISPAVFSSPGLTDESTAMVSIVVELDEEPNWNHNHIESTEIFDEMVFLTKTEARSLLRTGLDFNYNPYPVYTWAILMWFVSDMWKE